MMITDKNMPAAAGTWLYIDEIDESIENIVPTKNAVINSNPQIINPTMLKKFAHFPASFR